MKFVFSILLLAACAYAGPIVRDVQTTSVSAGDKPTVIVGSSQVDPKSEGDKITLHQRSQIGQDIIPTEVKVAAPQPDVPIVSEPKPVEEVKQPAPVSVPVASEPSKDTPILTGRSQPVSQDGVVVGKVSEPQGAQKAVPIPEKTLLVVEEVAVPAMLPAEPMVVFAPQVPASPEIPSPDVPRAAVPDVVIPEQAFIQPVFVPEVPQIVVEVPAQEPVPVVPVIGQPALEERSTASQIPIATGPLAAQVVVIPKEETAAKPIEGQIQEPQPVELAKPTIPVEQSARNFKVEQTPVKAPVVVSAVQKQVPTVEVKSEQKQVVVPSQVEGKHAVVPEVKLQPAVQTVGVEKNVLTDKPVQVQSVAVKPVEHQVPKVVLEERRSEPAPIQPVGQPIAVQPVVPEIVKQVQPEVVAPAVPQTIAVIAEPVQVPVVRVVVPDAEPKPVQPQGQVPVVEQPKQPQVQSVSEQKPAQ